MKVDFHSFFSNNKMTGASFYLYLSIWQPRYANRKIGTKHIFKFLKELMSTFHWYLTDFILI